MTDVLINLRDCREIVIKELFPLRITLNTPKSKLDDSPLITIGNFSIEIKNNDSIKIRRKADLDEWTDDIVIYDDYVQIVDAVNPTVVMNKYNLCGKNDEGA